MATNHAGHDHSKHGHHPNSPITAWFHNRQIEADKTGADTIDMMHAFALQCQRHQ